MHRVLLHGQQPVEQRHQVFHRREHRLAGLGRIAAGRLVAVRHHVGHRAVGVTAAPHQVAVHQVGEVLAVPVFDHAHAAPGSRRTLTRRRAARRRQAARAPVFDQAVAPHHEPLGALRNLEARLNPVVAHQRIEGQHVHVAPGQRKRRGTLEPRRSLVEGRVGLGPGVAATRIARPALGHVDQLHHAGAVGHQRVDEHAEDVAPGVILHAPQSGGRPTLAARGVRAALRRLVGRRHADRRVVGGQAAHDPLELLAGQRRPHLARRGSVGGRNVHRLFHEPQPPQALDAGIASAELGQQVLLQLVNVRLGRWGQRVGTKLGQRGLPVSLAPHARRAPWCYSPYPRALQL